MCTIRLQMGAATYIAFPSFLTSPQNSSANWPRSANPMAADNSRAAAHRNMQDVHTIDRKRFCVTHKEACKGDPHTWALTSPAIDKIDWSKTMLQISRLRFEIVRGLKKKVWYIIRCLKNNKCENERTSGLNHRVNRCTWKWQPVLRILLVESKLVNILFEQPSKARNACRSPSDFVFFFYI